MSHEVHVSTLQSRLDWQIVDSSNVGTRRSRPFLFPHLLDRRRPRPHRDLRVYHPVRGQAARGASLRDCWVDHRDIFDEIVGHIDAI
jgi:hypothetical protein